MRRKLEKATGEALAKAGIADADVTLEHPSELKRGDYATSVALQYAKQAGKAPRALAEELVDELRSSTVLGPTSIQRIEVAGPGFINFHLSSNALGRSISSAVEEDMWGSGDVLKGELVLIEYTSPNLFKPLHIGNLVGNVIGESVSRLLQFSGADVKRINYPSDIGLTVAKGVWGLKKQKADPSDIAALGEAYRSGNEAYETDEAAKKEIEEINMKLYDDSDAALSDLRRRGIETSRAHLDDICARLGTKFDLEFFESEAAPIGKELVLSRPDTFPESDGARVFRGEEHGLHTRVFLSSAGLPTYEAKELGNYSIKQEKYPDWTRYIVVTGVEQKEYFRVVIAAIQELFPHAAQRMMRHVANGFLTPTTGKMSSRKGNVITGESLIQDLIKVAKERAKESRADDHEKLAEQVAVAAIKYQVLKQASGKDIIFDRERALSLEGDSGPYLQYTYARASAVVEKAAQQDILPRFDESAPISDLARTVYRFPEIVERAAEEYEPHYLTTYLLQLAAAFNSWYAQEQILDGSHTQEHKVALTSAVARTLHNGLWILGIPAPERM